eukprot:jgi/Orpsp1_1/1175557/evm.model.c7180000054349.1
MATEIIGNNIINNNINKFYASLNEKNEHLTFILNKVNEKFQLKVIKINEFGNIYKNEIISKVIEEENKRFIDFGIGIKFELENGNLKLEGAMNEYCDSFETDLNIICTGLNINNNFCIYADTIHVKNNLLSNHYLTIKGKNLINEGLIYSPFLDLNFLNIENKGNIFGNKKLTINAKILKNINKSIINSSGSSNIIVKNYILNDDSTISAKEELFLYTLNMDQKRNSMIKCSKLILFVDKLVINEPNLIEVKNQSEINSNIFINRNDNIFLGKKVKIFTNMFMNDGYFRGEEIIIMVDQEEKNSDSKELTIFIKEYSTNRSKKLGGFLNLGEIIGKKIIIDTEKHVFNRKLIRANALFKLTTKGRLINDGDIIGKKVIIDTLDHLHNRKLIKAKKLFKLSTKQRLINEGVIYQEELNQSSSLIDSGTKVINVKGKIELQNNLKVKSGISFDNTEGKLKAQNLKIFLALDEKKEFLNNEEEKLASQTEKNKYSENVKIYQEAQRTVAGCQDPEEANKEKNNNNNKDKDSNLEKFPEFGFFVNTKGEVYALDSIKIKGSGALYNADNGKIFSRNKIHINIYGRILNQLGSKISTKLLKIKTLSKVFNTGGSRIEGDIQSQSTGFENGIGSVIEIMDSERSEYTASNIDSNKAIFNFGEIISPIKRIRLSSNTTLKNYGLILSEDTIEIDIPEEIMNSGKIFGKEVNLCKVARIFNKPGGVLEATEKDVTFKNGVLLSNEGRILSNNINLEKLCLNDLDKSSLNVLWNKSEENIGIIEAKDTLRVNSNYSLFYINGIWKSKKFILWYDESAEIDFSRILNGSENKIITQEAIFDFPRTTLINSKDTVLNYNTKIIASEFYNSAILHGKLNLTIEANSTIVNEFNNSL